MEIILPVSGKKVVLKSAITYGESKKLDEILFEGIKSMPNGSIDQSSVAKNVFKHNEYLVSIITTSIDGESFKKDDFFNMEKEDGEFLLAECTGILKGEKKKVS